MSDRSGALPLLPTGLASGMEKLRGHLAMILFAALISLSFSFGSLAVPHVGPAALNAMRFFIATMVMGLVVFAIYRRIPLPKAQAWRFGVLGLLMAIYFVTMFRALGMITPISSGAVFTLIPLMSAGFGFLFLRQTVRPIVLVSLLIAGCGSIWVIFRGDIQAMLSFDIGSGEIVFFFGCACHAAYAPLIKKLNRGEPVLLTTYWTTVATCIAISVYGMREIATTDWLSLPVVAWAAIGYLAIFTSAITFFLVQYASMRLPAAKVLSYGYLIPGFIILNEGFLGHGWVSFAVFAGAIVTVLGLIVVAFAPDL